MGNIRVAFHGVRPADIFHVWITSSMVSMDDQLAYSGPVVSLGVLVLVLVSAMSGHL